ncbi:anthranilate phosphoribosyltransferase [bacterium]|nr:MAG: anthranilate phosphoribosyltransferase [bacterium]
MTVSQALKAVTDGTHLSSTEAQQVLGDIAEGNPSPLQVAALLGAMRTRGETVPELVGFARGLRERVIPVRTTSTPLVDTCGTGGDAPKTGLGTFNISTAASLIASAAGVRIAKHGNRAVSSRSGSADVLEALGIHLDLSPDAIARCIDEVGIGFMFAPAHHPAMKAVAPVRRELGIRTMFNLLGPLANPANAERQVMGVPAHKWLRPIAETLRELGCERAIVVHSQDGLDEFSTCAPTNYIELKNGELSEHIFHPHHNDIHCLDASRLSGGDAAENAIIIEQILNGSEGPSADVTCLNAAAVLQVADIAPNWAEGLKLARATTASGSAREMLRNLRDFTSQFSK